MKNGEPIPLREMNLSKTCAHIKELRSQNQLSRPAVAAYLGVSESALRNYETGRRTPSIETFRRLCDLFHLNTIDEIIVWEEQRYGTREQSSYA